MVEPSPAAPSEDKRGLPIWLPLVTLGAVFLVAVLVGARVCPVLSALVFPPDPPLPVEDAVLLKPAESAGAGHDEWLYGMSLPACQAVTFYQERVGGCEYDLDSACKMNPNWGTQPRDGSSYPVAVCQGTTSIGPFYRVTWTVRIGGGYSQGGTTHVRITREVAN